MVRRRLVLKTKTGPTLYVQVDFDSMKHIRDYYKAKADALMYGRIAERTGTQEAMENAGKAHAALYALIIGEEALARVVGVFSVLDEMERLFSMLNDFILHVVDVDVKRCEILQRKIAAKAFKRQVKRGA